MAFVLPGLRQFHRKVCLRARVAGVHVRARRDCDFCNQKLFQHHVSFIQVVQKSRIKAPKQQNSRRKNLHSFPNDNWNSP